MSDEAKSPPFSEEAECAALGCALVHPEDVLTSLCGKLRASPEWFYIPAHRVIFEQLVAMMAAHRPVDLLTLTEWLKDRALLDTIGGPAKLEGLLDAAPTSAHAEHYALIVREKFLKRQTIEKARAMMDAAYQGEASAMDILSHGALAIADVAGMVETGETSNADEFRAMMAQFQYAHDRRESGEKVELPGLETQFDRLNDVLYGFQPALYFVAGQPSAGKTTIMEQISQYIAEGGNPVTVFSVDDTRRDYVKRQAVRMSGVSLFKLTQGFATREDLRKIAAEEMRFESLPIRVVDDLRTVEAIAAAARFHKAKYGTKLFVVDYVQIVGTEKDARYLQERQVLSVVCEELKALWKELNVPVVALSQTQRENYKEDTNPLKASMADFFGGAAMEQTMNVGIVLKTLKPTDVAPIDIDDTGYAQKFAVAAHVVKNKFGPRDICVPLWFHRKYFKFEQTQMYQKGTNKQQRWAMDWHEDIAWRNSGAYPEGGRTCTP